MFSSRVCSRAAVGIGLALHIDSAIATGGIDILIEGNQNLTSLDGLEQVIGVASIAIKSNPLLQDLNPVSYTHLTLPTILRV